MGIADYGVNPHTDADYSYTTDSFLGGATINSFEVYTVSTGNWASLQLNVVLVFWEGGNLYAFWIQNVAFIDSASNEIYFIDNVWNLSAPGAVIQNSTLIGNGPVDTPPGFYYDYAASGLPGNFVDLTYPATALLEVNSTISPSGEPQVSFSYNDGFGWITYDQVIFRFATDPSTLDDLGFLVDGFDYTGTGYLFYDAELIFGGPGGGSSTADVSSNVDLTLDYFNGNNYQATPSAYNFGSNTAETISNVVDDGYYLDSTGGLYGEVAAGAGTLEELWDPTEVTQDTFQVPDVYEGELFVGGAAYPFSDGSVELVLGPGTYLVEVEVFGVTESVGDYNLVMGTTNVASIPILEVPSAKLTTSALGKVTGDVVLTFTGSWPWSGAKGYLLLYYGAINLTGEEYTRLATGLSGSYIFHTSDFPDGNYSVAYEVVSPFNSANLTWANFYLENRQVTLAAEVGNLQTELNTANSTITSLTAQLASSRVQLAEVNATLLAVRAELTSANSTIQNLTDQIALLATDLGQNSSEVRHLESENANFTLEVSNLTNQVATLNSELASKSGYVAPAWYDSAGGALVYGLAVALLVVGLVVGIILGRRPPRRESTAAEDQQPPKGASSTGPPPPGQ